MSICFQLLLHFIDTDTDKYPASESHKQFPVYFDFFVPTKRNSLIYLNLYVNIENKMEFTGKTAGCRNT